MAKKISIEPVRRKEPDLRKLAAAFVALTLRERARQQSSSVEGGGSTNTEAA
jgi:hypothetical protein